MVCRVCGAPLPEQKGPGGRRKYCAGECATTAHQQQLEAYNTVRRVAKSKPASKRVYTGTPRPRSARDLEDLTLVARFQVGDEDAFTAIYIRYAPKLTNYIFRRCGDYGWAEDLVQEAMLKAARYIPHGQIHALEGYLILCVRQCWWLRVKQAQIRPTFEPYGSVRPDMGYVERAVLQRETLGDIIALLDTLPDDEREVAHLKLLYGYDLVSIASELEWATSRVRAVWRRCSRKFQAWAGSKSGSDALDQALVMALYPEAVPLESQCCVPGCCRARHAYERCEYHAQAMLEARARLHHVA